MASTASGGRPIAALPFAKTMGRSIRIGCAAIAAIRSSSALSRVIPASPNAASFVRIMAMAGRPSSSRAARISSAPGGSAR